MTFDNIPKGLQEMPRWLYANRDKAPSNTSGNPVDGTDPQNWLPFDTVVAHLNCPGFNPRRLLPFPGFEFMAEDSEVTKEVQQLIEVFRRTRGAVK